MSYMTFLHENSVYSKILILELSKTTKYKDISLSETANHNFQDTAKITAMKLYLLSTN